jgi:DNA topoisomerase I
VTNLLIVESPAKSKTLRSILGAGWNVQASLGHITELANDGDDLLGFTIAPDRVECRYQPRGDRGKKVIAQLRQAVKQADRVYLASDPDREGEGIAFHLVQQLRLKPGQYRRVTYNQMTAAAVKAAIANNRDLDLDLVGAQQARQCLDKLVGYKVSPLLWNSTGGKSAGRVQSPALHLVCQREQDIQNFQPVDYWSVWVEYQEGLRAYYFGSAGEAAQDAEDEPVLNDATDASAAQQRESRRVSSAEQAERLVQIARSQPHKVLQFAGKQQQKSPPPPYTTSSLQQSAGVKLGFNPEQTMTIAQALFEGIDLPQGRKALITYHRTDSMALSPEFCDEARSWLSQHDPDNVPKTITKHRDKAGAQGAHEAIRPNYLELTPAQVQPHLSADHFKLYDLIWRRAIAALCASAVLQKSRALIESGSILWESKGSVLVTAGYTRYWNDLSQDSQIPTLNPAQVLRLKQAVHTQKQTQPPSRYTEARLVQVLERLGIGRPSTYASIMKTLKEREYVKLQGKALTPTELGQKTDAVISQSVPNLVESDFTAEMEAALDAIAGGKQNWQRYLIDWHRDYFQPAIDRAYGKLGVKPKSASSQPGKQTEYSCPVCKKSLEEYTYQRDGQPKKLLRCSDAVARKGKCKDVAFFWTQRENWWSQKFGTIGEPGQALERSEVQCPECNQPLSKIPSGKVTQGYFLKCEQGCANSVFFWSDRQQIWERPPTKAASTKAAPSQTVGKSVGKSVGKPVRKSTKPARNL